MVKVNSTIIVKCVLDDFVSPGPMYYKPEKFYNAKQNPPKFTMAKRTALPRPGYIPGPNTYKLPSALGPCVPDKPCSGAFTMLVSQIAHASLFLIIRLAS